MNFASILGSVLGILALVGGQLLEGGKITQILQGTAALIVLGGTLGATLVSYPFEDCKRALRLLPLIYKKTESDLQTLIEDIFRIATIARKEGLLAIEGQRDSIKDPIFRRAIKYVIDGFEPGVVKEIVETEIDASFEREERAARVFEGAGGYAPTIGILGAVLGLIHVMTLLDDPTKIGEGIAVAFVATVYGVGLANLVLIPWGQRLRQLVEARALGKEIAKQGILGIQEGINPHFLKEKLAAMARQSDTPEVGAKAG